jgi:hypothetical protein
LKGVSSEFALRQASFRPLAHGWILNLQTSLPEVRNGCRHVVDLEAYMEKARWTVWRRRLQFLERVTTYLEVGDSGHSVRVTKFECLLHGERIHVDLRGLVNVWNAYGNMI